MSDKGNLTAGSWQRPVPPTQTAGDAQCVELKTCLRGTSEDGSHRSIPQSMEPIGKMTDQLEAPHGRNYPGRALPK